MHGKQWSNVLVQSEFAFDYSTVLSACNLQGLDAESLRLILIMTIAMHRIILGFSELLH